MFFYVYQHQNFDYLIINQVQVPLSVVVAWIMGIQMDLDFKLLETGCLAFGIIVTAFTLQVNYAQCHLYTANFSFLLVYLF